MSKQKDTELARKGSLTTRLERCERLITNLAGKVVSILSTGEEVRREVDDLYTREKVLFREIMSAKVDGLYALWLNKNGKVYDVEMHTKFSYYVVEHGNELSILEIIAVSEDALNSVVPPTGAPS